jgi:hypothetical protein
MPCNSKLSKLTLSRQNFLKFIQQVCFALVCLLLNVHVRLAEIQHHICNPGPSGLILGKGKLSLWTFT